ncbi:MAG: trypsin-like serine protease [Ruminococcaceae bacterium]|nr:trypsin-like serine protease [Oscillospiraceae bacterium]
MSEDFYNRDQGGSDEGNGSSSSDYGPKINFDDPIPPKRNKGGKTAVILVVAILFSLLCGFGGMMIGRNLTKPDPLPPTTSSGNTEGGGAKNNVIMQTTDASAASLDGSVLSVVEKCAASVVEIITTPYSNAISTVSGAGSGVIIGEDESGTGSYIVTNNHVIEGNFTVITVRTVDGKEYTAEVIGTDWQSDLAVLRIEKTGLTKAIWAESDVALGQSIVAIGNPLGSLGGSVSRGIISGVERTITVESVPMNLLQIDAAINPGNSGGGLFDLNGNLVGIVNAKSVATAVEGIGFAIPADHAVKIVTELCEKGYVSGRVDLGFRFTGSTANPLYAGMIVMSYDYSDEIENAIGANDILLTLQPVGGTQTRITSLADYRSLLVNLKDGDTVKAGLVGSNGYYEVVIKAHSVHK